MTEQEINVAIASLLPKLFVIHKPCHDPFGYYRENGQGYTTLEGAWTVTEEVAKKYASGRPTDFDRVVAEPAPIHNCCNDQNAMHEIEDSVIDPYFIDEYVTELYMVLERFWTPDRWVTFSRLGIDYAFTHATAHQRAEAFLRVKGLWKE